MTTQQLQPQTFYRAGMARYLELLAAPPAGARTYVVPPGTLPSDVITHLDVLPLAPRDAAKKLHERSTTGAFFFLSSESSHLVVPPFPIAQSGAWNGWNLEPLQKMLAKRPYIATALIRLNGYALGIWNGDTLVASKLSGSNVHGRNVNGGWSQARYARRRDNEVRQLYDRIGEALKEHLMPHESKLEYVFLGGDKLTLKGFHERIDWFAKKFGTKSPDALTLGRLQLRVLNAQEANREALEGILLREVWKFQVLSL